MRIAVKTSADERTGECSPQFLVIAAHGALDCIAYRQDHAIRHIQPFPIHNIVPVQLTPFHEEAREAGNIYLIMHSIAAQRGQHDSQQLPAIMGNLCSEILRQLFPELKGQK